MDNEKTNIEQTPEQAEQAKPVDQQTTAEFTAAEQGSLSIHTENIFPIIKKWLYSEHDIFLRELISNSVDAMSKRQAIDTEIADDLLVQLAVDKDAATISVIDYGIGMTAEEIKKYINQIAFSSAEEFVEKFKDKNIIGHFGLGFYSAFMVADKVVIDSLSYQPGSEPARWMCDGSTSFSMGTGTRTKPGTTVTLYLNSDSKEYLEDNKIRDLVRRYSNFMPFEVRLGDEILNQKEALWNRKPSDVTDEEYKEFYKEMFMDYEDPLFWIHLNVDFPFRLKGILYFPRIKNMLEVNRGTVKLYCNNVFVADNLKEFTPEFLLLLKGGIDVPDIPLNVSRSFLQNDAQVKKISTYIIKKVADHLNDLFTGDREKFAEMWTDIEQFIKFGVLTNDKFSQAVKDIMVFKSASDKWLTVNEYLEANKTEDAPKPFKLFYARGNDTQVSYLKFMAEKGTEVLFAPTPLDVHVLQHLETRSGGEYTFARIDSEINNDLVDEEATKAEFEANKETREEEKVTHDKDGNEKKETVTTEVDLRSEKFNNLLDNKGVTVQVKHFVSDEIPGMVIFNEHMRRFHEMNQIGNRDDFDLLASHTFVVNSSNPAVKSIFSLAKEGKKDEAAILANYIHQLSLLEQKQFSGKELRAFVAHASKVLKMIK